MLDSFSLSDSLLASRSWMGWADLLTGFLGGAFTVDILDVFGCLGDLVRLEIEASSS